MSDEVRVDDLKDLWRAGKVNLPTVAVHDARPQPEYPELNGATVEQVVASVEQALNALRRIMDGEEAFIAEPVNAHRKSGTTVDRPRPDHRRWNPPQRAGGQTRRHTRQALARRLQATIMTDKEQ